MNNYFDKYFNKLSKFLINFNQNEFSEIIKILKKIKKNKKKVILVGNGGSAAIASHVSVDFNKMCKIRAINFNEADLITCFSNDYGYENWVKEALKFYADKGDLFIIDKWLTIVDGKSDDEYSKDAYDASKSEIDAWDNSFAKIGKTFNPDTGKME